MTGQSNGGAYDPSVLAEQLQRFDAERPGALCKGISPFFNGSFGDFAGKDLSLDDPRLPMPVAVLREDVMAGNRRWMSEYLKRTGVNLAPHGKTSLAPTLFRMQLEDGVWGLTAASAQQVVFFAELGIRRIILANQLVGAGNIALTLDCLERHPELDLYLLVDSRENVDQLMEATIGRQGIPPMKLLIEIGVEGGRTGLRSAGAALDLARHIHFAAGLSLAGVEGYEGIVPGADQATRETAVAGMVAKIHDIASLCDAEDLWDTDEILLTAGGTEFFDLCSGGLTRFTGTRPHRVVIRSGCYITSDSIAYKRAFRRMCERSADVAAMDLPPPQGALEVWAAVQSRPEPGLAFATLGKRDISHDWDLPVPLRWLRPGRMAAPQAMPAGHRVLRLNDQHAYLEIPDDSPLVVGDLIGFGVSHACTTFDKWRAIFTVDDGDHITGTIRTFF